MNFFSRILLEVTQGAVMFLLNGQSKVLYSIVTVWSASSLWECIQKRRSADVNGRRDRLLAIASGLLPPLHLLIFQE